MKPDSMERFETAWRAHASRPTDLPPAEAARAVLARIDHDEAITHRAPDASWRGLVAMAASLVIVAALTWLLPLWWQPNETRSPEIEAVVADHGTLVAPRTDTDVILFWLDRDTPLYMTMRPVRGEKQ